MALLAGLLLLVGLLVWLFRKPAAPSEPPGWEDQVEPVDAAELEAAERDVKDLDVQQRPEDGFAGDDWGPGAAKR
ncbi:MAG: hypothetical protein ABI587_00915 [Gemmatimonadales bacterium]